MRRQDDASRGPPLVRRLGQNGCRRGGARRCSRASRRADNNNNMRLYARNNTKLKKNKNKQKGAKDELDICVLKASLEIASLCILLCWGLLVHAWCNDALFYSQAQPNQIDFLATCLDLSSFMQTNASVRVYLLKNTQWQDPAPIFAFRSPCRPPPLALSVSVFVTSRFSNVDLFEFLPKRLKHTATSNIIHQINAGILAVVNLLCAMILTLSCTNNDNL